MPLKPNLIDKQIEFIKNPFNTISIKSFNRDAFKALLNKCLSQHSIKIKKNKIQVVILAAGKGSRMRIDYPKSLFKLKYPNGSFNLLDNTLNNLDFINASIEITKINIVINETELDFFKSYKKIKKVSLITLHPSKINGTALCIKEVLPLLNNKEDVLFIWGDLAIWDPKDFSLFLSTHFMLSSKATFPTRIMKNPYVAFIRDRYGGIKKVIHANEETRYKGTAEQDCLAFALGHDSLKHITSFLETYKTYKGEVDFIHFLPYLTNIGIQVVPLPICDKDAVSGLNNQKKVKEINEILSEH